MNSRDKIELPQKRLRIAFFGTPEIASTVLEGLLDADEDDVVLVICQPDRPKGRGKKLVPPPTKVLAESRGVPVIQPTKMRDGTLTQRLKDEKIDLSIVTAFGRILPQDMLDAPVFDSWNVHASILPRHRGAAPINFAILEGDEETGITLMEMTAGLDEGPMLTKTSMPIPKDATTETLTRDLAQLGRDALLEGLRAAKQAGLEKIPQNEAEATFAPLLEKKDGQLDFEAKSAIELERQVRALDPWPGTFVRESNGQPLKIKRAHATEGDGPPGTVARLGDTLDVFAKSGTLAIEVIQPPGKREMPAAEYLRGAGRRLTQGKPVAIVD